MESPNPLAKNRYRIYRVTPRIHTVNSYGNGTHQMALVPLNCPPLPEEVGQYDSWYDAQESSDHLNVAWEEWATWTPEQRRVWHAQSSDKYWPFIDADCLHLWGVKHPKLRLLPGQASLWPRRSPTRGDSLRPQVNRRPAHESLMSSEFEERSQPMTVKVFPTELFGLTEDGGPRISWWLYGHDLEITGTEMPWENSIPSDICGAQYGKNWIVFKLPVVLQFCSVSTHSNWHRDIDQEEELEEGDLSRLEVARLIIENIRSNTPEG